MGLKNGGVGHRAWNLLRVSLLWARKGGVLRRRVAMELRLVPKYLKRLGHNNNTPTSHINYFERELSFDKTPIFHVKMYRPSSMRFHLPHIPCINPHAVDFDYDFNDDDDDDDDDDVEEYVDSARKSSIVEEINQEMMMDCGEGGDEQGVDKRAEEFIAKFYHQMKLQRQISLLQYNQTPNRDTTC